MESLSAVDFFIKITKMSVFDALNPLAHVTPRFTEEQLEEMVQWFDENAKPLLTINDAPEPTNVIP